MLEEGISDEEAIHLIQQSGGSDIGSEEDSKTNGDEEEEENHWRRSDSGNAQALTLDGGSPDPADPNDDPFTANLMNFYVSMICLCLYKVWSLLCSLLVFVAEVFMLWMWHSICRLLI